MPTTRVTLQVDFCFCTLLTQTLVTIFIGQETITYGIKVRKGLRCVTLRKAEL